MSPARKRALPCSFFLAWAASFSYGDISYASFARSNETSSHSIETSCVFAASSGARSAHPGAPYPHAAGAVTRHFSPAFISRTASSSAGSTARSPAANVDFDSPSDAPPTRVTV